MTEPKLSLDAVSPSDLSRQLRRGTGAFLRQRRGILGCSLAAAGAMGLIALYQMGLLRHLPEPPLPHFDADKVDASGEAYAWLSTPDGVLGLANYAVTAVLAAAGGRDRARRRPWLPLALAAKTGADALQAGRLSIDQWTQHRAFCFWCLGAAAATFAAAALAVPEARAALHTLRSK
jgi:uncharacterized membrane protein